MSDQWETFPCQMGEHPAFISYDHGVKEVIDSLGLPNFAGFRVELSAPDDRGLPHGQEFDRLNRLEDYLAARIDGDAGLQVGRVTTNGQRYFHFYTTLDEEACAAIAREAQLHGGYEVALLHEEDPQRTHYWGELFPTDDDWQVIQDLRVQQSLESHGDTLEQAREIVHWAHFPTEAARAAFLQAVGDLVECVELYEAAEDAAGRFAVRMKHEGRPDHVSINRYTLALARHARAQGGAYDGWETCVCRP